MIAVGDRVTHHPAIGELPPCAQAEVVSFMGKPGIRRAARTRALRDFAWERARALYGDDLDPVARLMPPDLSGCGPQHFVLVDGQPPEAAPLMVWSLWFELAHNGLKQSYVDWYGARIFVSTMFLGLNHGFRSLPAPPVLYETMIFWDGHRLDNWQDRYTTAEAARAGHDAAHALALRTYQQWLRNGGRNRRARLSHLSDPDTRAALDRVQRRAALSGLIGGLDAVLGTPADDTGN